MINILFICVGNTCRSVMCEYILKYKIAEKKLDNKFKIKSCGIYINPDQPANENAIEAISNLKTDINNHITTPISTQLLETSNYIFTLDKIILNFIEKNFYNHIKGHLACINKEGIPDPYGTSLEYYKSCAQTIEKCLDEILKNIIKNEKL